MRRGGRYSCRCDACVVHLWEIPLVSIMSDVVEAAFTTAQGMSGEEVTLWNGAVCIAVPGRTDTAQDAEGVVVQWQEQDWLIRTADIPRLPKNGDTITESNGRQWRAQSDTGMPPFRFNDPYRIVVRMHTKLVHASHED